MSQRLHIVCLDAPSPANYGGAIDMYWKIEALHRQGKKIILHYFDYKKGRSAAGLEAYCEEIHAYERKTFWSSSPFRLPYIVGSRIHPQLIQRLNAGAAPILLEGLHCAGLVSHLNDPARAVVRMHNEEADYYARLAGTTDQWLKKIYYRRESRMLRSFYRQLASGTRLACLSSSDAVLLKERYGFTEASFIPCFLPWQQIASPFGKGDYCLYHGNLAIPENEAAVAWLITEVFEHTNVPFVIAGQRVSQKIFDLAAPLPHVRIIATPPADELEILIRDAHIHVLPSFNNTGVKLKLLHALFAGRFCLVNAEGVKGSGLTSLVEQAETANEFSQKILSLYQQDFTEEHKKDRRDILAVYDNSVNARKLSALW